MTRNNNIDLLRLLCAAEVVFAHAPFLSPHLMDPSFAVPCFLMISGYFVYDRDSKTRERRIVRGAKSIARIILWSTAFYFLYHGYYCLRDGLPLLTTRQLAEWGLCNATPYGPHLWYLYAYLYVLAIVFLLNRRGHLAILKYATPVFILLLLVLGQYSVVVVGRAFNELLTRNFLMLGLPFFTIGMWIKEALITPPIWLQRHKSLLPLIVAASAGLWLTEKFTLLHHHAAGEGVLYVGSLGMALSLFLWAVTAHNSRPSLLATIGREDTLYIYVYHIVVLNILTAVVVRTTPPAVYNAYTTVAAPLVLLLTILLLRLYRRLSPPHH